MMSTFIRTEPTAICRYRTINLFKLCPVLDTQSLTSIISFALLSNATGTIFNNMVRGLAVGYHSKPLYLHRKLLVKGRKLVFYSGLTPVQTT